MTQEKIISTQVSTFYELGHHKKVSPAKDKITSLTFVFCLTEGVEMQKKGWGNRQVSSGLCTFGSRQTRLMLMRALLCAIAFLHLPRVVLYSRLILAPCSRQPQLKSLNQEAIQQWIFPCFYRQLKFAHFCLLWYFRFNRTVCSQGREKNDNQTSQQNKFCS